MAEKTDMSSQEQKCPRCAGPLARGKAMFGIGQLLRGAMFEESPKPPTLQDCLKCSACGYSETLPHRPAA